MAFELQFISSGLLVMPSDTFCFFGYEIPEALAVITGGGGETFQAVADQHIQLLQQHVGIESHFSVLEIGCGVGRDAIPLTSILSSEGRYFGIDIVKASIDWCSANIALRHPNFSFSHYDISSHMYNPVGLRHATEIKFDIADQSIDRIFLWSVFTHMLENDVRHYLKEFRRVLKPSGLVLASWFVVDEDILRRVKSGHPLFNLTFEYPLAEGCHVNVLEAPLGAVAYTLPRVNDMIVDAGLTIEKFVRGYWPNPSTRKLTSCGQDITVMSGML